MITKWEDTHYHWLEVNLETFLGNLGIEHPDYYLGLIGAHGDKFPDYHLKNTNIPHEHALAIYLLTYVFPWKLETRETDNGWVDPIKWVLNNYERFRKYLPEQR